MTNSPGWSRPDAEEPSWPRPGTESGSAATDASVGWGSPPPGSGWGPPAGWTPPPAPGVIPLRPLGLGEILDGAFSVVRRHAKVTMAWSAIIVILGQALTVGIGLLDGSLNAALNASASPFQTGAITGRALSVIISAATGGVLTGVVAIIVSEAVLGRKPTFAEVWLRTRPRLLPLLGVAVAAGVLPWIGLLFLVIPGIFLWGVLALAPPALMLERLAVGSALRRSRQLVSGDWWRVFGIRTLAVLIGFAVGALLALPTGLVGALAAGDAGSDSLTGIALVIIAVVGVVASVLTQPFVAAVVALLYVDRRMRAEGLDVALAQAAGAAPPPAEPGLAGQ